MNNPGLLIFDLDGTLFMAETVTLPAVQQNLQAWGLPLPTERELRSLLGKPAGEYHAWLRSRCPQDHASELIAAIDRKELELISETGKLYPRVPEVLATLRSCVGQIALCSNGPQEYVERVITAHGLRQFFDVVRYWQSDRDNKPLMVRELLKRLEGRPAIVIGDRHDDVEAAHQNGLQAIAAMYGYGTAEELEPADAKASSPADLPDLVRSVLASQS